MILKLCSMILIILLIICAVLPSWAQDEAQQEAIQRALDSYIRRINSDVRNLALHREFIEFFGRKRLINVPIDIYRNSLERSPSNITFIYALSYAYLIEGTTESLEMAKQNLDALLKTRPQFSDAVAALGDYYLKAEQPDLAVAKWQEALRINERCEPAHLSLARFYRSQKKYAEAIEKYQRTISFNPKRSAERYLELGDTYLEMGELSKAEKAFLQAKKYDSNMSMAYYKLGQVYARRGERDKAVKIYRTGRKYDPYNAAVAYELAYIFLEMDDVKYALLSMERGLSTESVDPKLSEELIAYIEKGTIAAANFMSQLADFEYSDNFHLHYFLGKLYLKLDDKNLALRHFRSAAAISPSNADVHYQLALLQEKSEPEKGEEQYKTSSEPGVAEAEPLFKAAQSYLKEGNEAKFIETARQALAIDPGRVEVHLQLAEIFRKRADVYRNNGQNEKEDEAVKEAVKHYEQAATLQPSAQRWYNLGLLYERQKGIKAVRAYDKAIQLDPNFALAYYRRGHFRLNYKVGRVTKTLMYQPQVAVEDLKKAIELDSKLADAHFSLGMAYHQMDMPELATAEFAKTVEVDPDNVKAHIYLAQDYAASGDYQKVIHHLSKAAELDDSNAEVLKTLGGMLLKHGGDDAVKPAQKALEKAVKLNPDDAEVLMNYGYTLYLDRMFETAIENYEKALEIQPDYPEANYNIALAYSGARKYQLARQHWEKVIELVPGTPLADKAADFLQKMEKSGSP